MSSKIAIHRVTLVLVALFLIAGALIALNWKEMRQVLGKANWFLLAPSFLFTALSYLCLGISLAIVFRVFQTKEDFSYLVRVGFVSNAAFYLLNVGGTTGVSLQYMLLKTRGLESENILAPSLFQLYCSGLMLTLQNWLLFSAKSSGLGIKQYFCSEFGLLIINPKDAY
jgi:uncharacterized membrane protein YbhN (UPF0104 family)